MRLSEEYACPQVTPVLRCVDGFACVAVSCVKVGAEDAENTLRNLYVGPQHLRVPEDEGEWETAVQQLFI